MVNKTYIQITLFILIILSLFIFYKTYFKKNENLSTQVESLEKKAIENDDNENLDSNLIYNLSYKSSDIENNQYFINSESGIMSENGSEFLMNRVSAKIILNDSQRLPKGL